MHFRRSSFRSALLGPAAATGSTLNRGSNPTAPDKKARPGIGNAFPAIPRPERHRTAKSQPLRNRKCISSWAPLPILGQPWTKVTASPKPSEMHFRSTQPRHPRSKAPGPNGKCRPLAPWDHPRQRSGPRAEMHFQLSQAHPSFAVSKGRRLALSLICGWKCISNRSPSQP